MLEIITQFVYLVIGGDSLKDLVRPIVWDSAPPSNPTLFITVLSPRNRAVLEKTHRLQVHVYLASTY